MHPLDTNAVGPVVDQEAVNLLDSYRQRLRTLRLLCVVVPMAVLLVAVLAALRPSTVDLVFAPILLLLSVFLVPAGMALARMGGWIGPARALLSRQPWRSEPARLLGRASQWPVIELAGGPEPVRLQLVGVPAEAGPVIERSGQVDVLGPGAKGWAVVRIAAMRWPLPAKMLAPDASIEPSRQLMGGPAGTAAEDPVVASWANRLERMSRWALLSPAVLLVIAAYFPIAAPLAGMELALWLPPAVAFAACAGWGLVRVLRVARPRMGLSRLAAAGPWTRVPVRLAPWNALPAGMGNATGTAALADGSSVSVRLPKATYEHLAAAAETGELWVAGTPRPGASVACGLPGLPVLTAARFGPRAAART